MSVCVFQKQINGHNTDSDTFKKTQISVDGRRQNEAFNLNFTSYNQYNIH